LSEHQGRNIGDTTSRAHQRYIRDFSTTCNEAFPLIPWTYDENLLGSMLAISSFHAKISWRRTGMRWKSFNGFGTKPIQFPA
ncbi:hypothetical protein PIB30_113718, partial [Stylosanthes scabra]|nr:hypothetical protein [Stylosanthes scabra]